MERDYDIYDLDRVNDEYEEPYVLNEDYDMDIDNDSGEDDE